MERRDVLQGEARARRGGVAAPALGLVARERDADDGRDVLRAVEVVREEPVVRGGVFYAQMRVAEVHFIVRTPAQRARVDFVLHHGAIVAQASKGGRRVAVFLYQVRMGVETGRGDGYVFQLRRQG